LPTEKRHIKLQQNSKDALRSWYQDNIGFRDFLFSVSRDQTAVESLKELNDFKSQTTKMVINKSNNIYNKSKVTSYGHNYALETFEIEFK